MLLTKVTRTGGVMNLGPQPTTTVTLDVGRNLALFCVVVVALGLATILYLNSQSGPATALMSIGSAVLGGQFGIVVGERSGVNAQG